MKMDTKTIAVMAVYAALYAALCYVLAPISYGALQVRVSGALLGIVPIIGWGGVFGQALGVFIANLNSPLGLIDLANAGVSLVMTAILYKLYTIKAHVVTVAIGTILYSIVISCSVGWMLNMVFGAPLIETILYVTAGNIIATTVIGVPIYYAVRRSKALDKWFGSPKK